MLEEGDFVTINTPSGSKTGHIMVTPGATIYVETDDGDIVECNPADVSLNTGFDTVAAETARILEELQSR